MMYYYIQNYIVAESLHSYSRRSVTISINEGREGQSSCKMGGLTTTMKKTISMITISIALAATMTVSAYAAPSTTETGGAQAAASSSPVLKTFGDIGNHWGKAAIEWAVSQGITDGFEDGTFRPDETLTRAQFVKLVVAALKLPVTGTPSGSDWYKPYVTAAEKAGFSEKFNDWNQPMSRQEMAKMAVRAAGQNTDDDLKWMFLATKAGLIQGTDDTGTLDVEGTTTRAQSVTIMQRILDVKAGKTLEADKRATSRAEVLWHKTNIETMLDGDYIDVASTPEEDRFNPYKDYSDHWAYTPAWVGGLRVEHDNGNVKAWTDGLFVIDLDDPYDPYKYLLDGAKVWDSQNQADISLPSTGAYVVVTVTNLEVEKNTYNITWFDGAPLLRSETRFIYKGNSIFLDRAPARTYSVNFFSSDGNWILPEAGSIMEGGVFTSRNGRLFPKVPGEAEGTEFIFQFRGFQYFGDALFPEFSYKIHNSRLKGGSGQ